jgi:hypothetical protein
MKFSERGKSGCLVEFKIVGADDTLWYCFAEKLEAQRV